jgi:hypothetical protein
VAAGASKGRSALVALLCAELATVSVPTFELGASAAPVTLAGTRAVPSL